MVRDKNKKNKNKNSYRSRLSLLLLTALIFVLASGQLSNAGLVCKQCEKPIDASRYFVVDGENYDSLCYVTHIAGKCGYCNEPISGSWYVQAGQKYHSKCMVDFVLPRCLVCDSPLFEAHYSDGLGGHVCDNHLGSVDNCHSCQRFVKEGKTEGLGRFNDGRLACANCLATAVVDLTQAERLMRTVRRELARLGIEITVQAKLELVNVDQLLRQSQGFVNDPLGVTIYRRETIFGGLVSFKDFRLFILNGLPEAHLKAVLAHELMHVWIFANAGDDHESLLCEGSCEYAAYRVLLNDRSESGQFYLAHLLDNDDPIYGVGFLQVKNLVDQLGISGWLAYLKTNRTVPRQATADY